MRTLVSLLSSLPLALLLACGDDGGDGGNNQADATDCLPKSDFFQEKLWTPVLKSSCLGCHRAGGPAGNTAFVLADSDADPSQLDANMTVVNNLMNMASDVSGVPYLLAKGSGQVSHGGGSPIATDGEDYQNFIQYNEIPDGGDSCQENSAAH